MTVKMPMARNDDILIGAMVRSYMEQNNALGWYTEVVIAKEMPRSYEVKFEDKTFKLEKFSSGGHSMDTWERNSSSYCFKLLDTPIDVYRFLKDIIKFLDKTVGRLRENASLEKAEKGEWVPIDKEKRLE